ncbi:chitin binding domain-containing protein [Acanthocystis turfacea Chlorella virus Can0610SP]|nr:chitin binding domain-containing protein [Acanthocystis turfacea Chlorella virus Can0610SP]
MVFGKLGIFVVQALAIFSNFASLPVEGRGYLSNPTSRALLARKRHCSGDVFGTDQKSFFYKCSNGTPFKVYCPDSTVWSTDSSACDWPKKRSKRTHKKKKKTPTADSAHYSTSDSSDSTSESTSDSTSESTPKPSHGGKGVRATYHYYADGTNSISSLYCADEINRRDINVGSPTKWLAYCVTNMSQDKCGKRATITNKANDKSVVGIVVDKCGFGGVDLDPGLFNAIDDGQGMADGHMTVTVALN